jgi:hypothetical protein
MEHNGMSSYKIEIKPGVTHLAHLDQLKPYVHDYKSGQPVVHFQFQAGFKAEGLTTGDGWIKSILKHRQNPQGGYEFLVRWHGTPCSDSVWEPWDEIYALPGSALAEYLTSQGLHIPAGQPVEDPA